jgi:hypothetical protein
MNLKNTSIFCLIAFFPIFALKSNLSSIEIIFLISVFLIPIFILNYFLIKKKFFNYFFFKIYISLLIVMGIDNSFGLWNGLIQPFKVLLINSFTVIYYPAFGLLVFLIIIFYIVITFSNEKFLNVIIIFMSTIFIFSIVDQNKSYKNLKDYKIPINNEYNNTDIVIILDEMSGLNSYESKTARGITFDTEAKEFFKKYNFEYYNNIKSINPGTKVSISSLVNLASNKMTSESLKESENYFYNYEIHKNLFFENFKNISVYQNIYIDFCGVKNISKCKTSNPFNERKYVEGFKDTFLTKIVSLWKLNGSIVSTLTWRTLREIRVIDSILDPEGQKASFIDLFFNIEKDIISKNYDLIFVHTLVPHKPYGFNEKCNYDGRLSLRNTFFSTNKKVNQHNIERLCVLSFLDDFLQKLKKNNNLENINLTLMSDHGARITNDDDSSLSVIYAYRDKQTKYKEFDDETTSQKIFRSRYNYLIKF